MKFFSFLTNCRGKVNPRAALGLLGGVAAAGLTIGGYQHDVKNYPPERLTFAGLESDGGSYYGSAMDYSDNLGVVDPSWGGKEEGGAKYVNVDNLGAGLRIGNVYQTGGGDNLVGNGVTDTGKITYGGDIDGPSAGGYIPPYGGGGDGGANPYGDGGGNGGGNGNGPGSHLVNASIPHAGGSGGGNYYTPGGPHSDAGGNGGGNGGNPGAGGTPTKEDGYQMTGLMPSGSVDRVINGTPSKFSHGDRELLAKRGKPQKYGEGLAGIAKHSADIAARVHKENANAQGRVFLNGQEASVGGIKFASPEEVTDDSDDLAPVTITKAPQGINNWEKDKKDYVKRLAKKRKDLAKRILILIGVTLGVAVAMNYLIQIGKNMLPNPWGWAVIASGWALMAGVSWYAIDIMKRANEFMHEFKTDAGSIGTLGIGFSATAMAFLTYVGIRALVTKGTPGGDMRGLWTTLIRHVKGLFVSNVVPMGTDAIKKVITTANSDPNKP